MIRKLVRQMLTAQILSALTVSLCLLIDNIMISRYLGETAMAAYGLSNPILLAIGAIGTLLAAGIQMACSKSLGRGSQEETNAGYSSAIALAGSISLGFTVVVLLFASPLATVMGAGSEGALFEQTRDYLIGFSAGAPGSMGALVLVPFLQMAGQSNLLIAAVLTMTVTDVALDLLNVLVWHGGMLGMGLASAISYYAAMIVAAFYFISKRCVFRFSRRLVTKAKIRELFTGGVPAGFNMAASVILVFILNRILQGVGGETAVAAYTVVMALGNAANCITTGIGGVSLTLAGVLYNEEDRSGLRELISYLVRCSLVLGLAMGAVLVALAPTFVSVFVPQGGPVSEMAVLGLRLFAAGMIPCCINNALKNMYQATGRVRLTEIISMAEGAIFPALAGFVFSRLLGTQGAWLFFACGEALTLLSICLGVFGHTRELPWRKDACLLLDSSFGVGETDLLEAQLHSMEEVAGFVKVAEQFCLDRGQSAKGSNHIALCIEEMAGNTILHGFKADGKPHHLSVRVLHKPGTWVLRFRDDCRAFDPVHYVPEGDEDGLGIRLVRAMATEARYTYSLNMNNLTLTLPEVL